MSLGAQMDPGTQTFLGTQMVLGRQRGPWASPAGPPLSERVCYNDSLLLGVNYVFTHTKVFSSCHKSSADVLPPARQLVDLKPFHRTSFEVRNVSMFSGR